MGILNFNNYICKKDNTLKASKKIRHEGRQ